MKPTDKAPKRLISIRGKIFAALLVIIAIALALLWLCQVILYDTVYSNVRINEIRSTARHAMLFSDKNSFYSQLAAASAQNDLCAAVLTPDGTVTYSAENSSACLIHQLSGSKIRELIVLMEDRDAVTFGITREGNGYSVTELSSIPFPEGTNVIFLGSFTHNGEDLYLMLDGVISPIGTVTKTAASFLILLSLILIPVAVIVAQGFSKLIANPIAKISDQAKKLSTGEYTEVESNTTEIAELNESLLQAKRDLQQVDHLRHELIANISHDLRTPLTLMGGYLEMMRDFPEEITEENLSTVIDESKRLSSLVSDLLDVARYENGIITPDPKPFCLTDAIEKTVASYDEFTRREGYQFTFHYDEKITVIADKTLVMQVVTNLINNAMTYTGDDKSVVLTQSVQNGKVRIDVSDTGIGIDQDNLPLIWDRYYKVDAAHKRAAKGTGLGLSIVRQIITLHAGSYGVRSQVGRGSTFWFELPYTPLDDAPAAKDSFPFEDETNSREG